MVLIRMVLQTGYFSYYFTATELFYLSFFLLRLYDTFYVRRKTCMHGEYRTLEVDKNILSYM